MRSRSAEAGLLAFVVSLLAALATARAAEPAQHCVRAEIVLWGDGRHDDTVALNAWFRGEDAVWADSGDPVGGAIADHSFRLSDALYVSGGSGRTLRNFRMLWPERGETVSGGTIAAGSDPQKEPISTGITIVGGDSGEGVPFDAPDAAKQQDPQASCATS